MLGNTLNNGALISWLLVTGAIICVYLKTTRTKKNNTLFTYPLFGVFLCIGATTTSFMTFLIWWNNLRELLPDNSAEGFAYTLEALKPAAIVAAGFLAILGLIASQHKSEQANQQIKNAEKSLDQSKLAYELSAYYSFKEDFIETADKELASEDFSINTSHLFKLIYPNVGKLTPNSSEGSIIDKISSLWEECSKRSNEDTDYLLLLLAELHQHADFKNLKNETDINLLQHAETTNKETWRALEGIIEKSRLCGIPGSKLASDHLPKESENCTPKTTSSAFFTDMKIIRAGAFASKLSELIFSFCPGAKRPKDLPARESADKPGIGMYFYDHTNWNKTFSDLTNQSQSSAGKVFKAILNGDATSPDSGAEQN